jgi:putative FmdB family regulatory protein
MPTYQYRCIKCGKDFEVFQKMSDLALESCPYCQGKVERIISGGAGFLLKGTGFYATDHRSSDYKKAVEAEKTKPEIVTKKPESAKDTKP